MVCVVVALLLTGAACSKDDPTMPTSTASDLIPSVDDFEEGWSETEFVADAPKPYEETVIRCATGDLEPDRIAGLRVVFDKELEDDESSAAVFPVALEMGSEADANSVVNTMTSESFSDCLDEQAEEDPVNNTFFSDYNYGRSEITDVLRLEDRGVVDEALYLELEVAVEEPDGSPSSPIVQGLSLLRRGSVLQIARIAGATSSETVDETLDALFAKFGSDGAPKP